MTAKQEMRGLFGDGGKPLGDFKKKKFYSAKHGKTILRMAEGIYLKIFNF